jgi:hypothetical protein
MSGITWNIEIFTGGGGGYALPINKVEGSLSGSVALVDNAAAEGLTVNTIRYPEGMRREL